MSGKKLFRKLPVFKTLLVTAKAMEPPVVQWDKDELEGTTGVQSRSLLCVVYTAGSGDRFIIKSLCVKLSGILYGVGCLFQHGHSLYSLFVDEQVSKQTPVLTNGGSTWCVYGFLTSVYCDLALSLSRLGKWIASFSSPGSTMIIKEIILFTILIQGCLCV